MVNGKKSNGRNERLPKTRSQSAVGNSFLWLNKGYPLLLFLISGFLLFGYTLSFSYTYLDDQNLILGSLDKLRQFSYIEKAFTEDVFHTGSGVGFYYRPVLTLTFMADAMLGRGSFAMFHFSNILYHVLATWLLFLFFSALGQTKPKSFVFSLIFLVHPLITQAVAWVPGRNDTLLAIFVLASFIMWLKFLDNGKVLTLSLHFLFYILALLTKENAVVLPVISILYSALHVKIPAKKYILPVSLWIIFTLVWAVIRFRALGGQNEVSMVSEIMSAFENLPALLPFLGKIFFPVNLSVFPIMADMKFSSISGAIACVLLVVLVAMSKPRRWFFYLFGFSWFLLFLLPSFVMIQTKVPNFSEHRVYLSMAGILIILLYCNPFRRFEFSRRLTVLLIALVVIFFSVLTLLHSGNFRDRFTFWTNAVKTSPTHAFNYNNLGAMYYLADSLEKAEPYFRKALEINPYEPMANSNTGLICMRTNRPAEAERYYLEEIRINPMYDHAYYNLGLLYYNHSRVEEAICQWEKTIDINPVYTDAYKALLLTYEQLQRMGDYQRIVSKGRANGVIE